MMYRKPTEHFEKTLQTQEPKTCEGKKIDMTEVTLDQELNVNSQEFHLLMLFTQRFRALAAEEDEQIFSVRRRLQAGHLRSSEQDQG